MVLPDGTPALAGSHAQRGRTSDPDYAPARWGARPVEPLAFPHHSMATWTINLKAMNAAGEDRNIELSIGTYHAHLDLPPGECGSNVLQPNVPTSAYHAHLDLPPGEWMKMWEGPDKPFGITKAEKHDAVGEWAVKIDSLDRGNLPRALNALDVLRKLDAGLVHDLIVTEDIHSKMKVKEAQALVARLNGSAKPAAVQFSTTRWSAKLKRVRQDLDKGATLLQKQIASEEFKAFAAELDAECKASTSNANPHG